MSFDRKAHCAKMREIKALKAQEQKQTLAVIEQQVENKEYHSLSELVQDFSILDTLAFQALKDALLCRDENIKRLAFKDWLYVRFELPSKLQVEHSIGDMLHTLSTAELERMSGLRSKEDLMIELAEYKIEEGGEVSDVQDESKGGTCSTPGGEENTYTNGGVNKNGQRH
jgi:hypothetical protein